MKVDKKAKKGMQDELFDYSLWLISTCIQIVKVSRNIDDAADSLEDLRKRVKPNGIALQDLKEKL